MIFCLIVVVRILSCIELRKSEIDFVIPLLTGAANPENIVETRWE